MDSQDNNAAVFPFLDECAMISLCAVEAQLQECFHQCLIPVPFTLLQAVEGFEKPEYVVFWIRQLIFLWLFHENLFIGLQDRVEECAIKVEALNRPVVAIGSGKKNTKYCKSSNRCVHFIVVHTVDLGEASGN